MAWMLLRRPTDMMNSTSLSNPGSGHGTILLVDDDQNVRLVIEKSLQRLGYLVLSAVDGPNALSVANAHSGPIDLLLTDVLMPKMSGVNLAKQLRNRRGTLRVIFMSSMLGEDGISRRNGDGFLRKPFSFEALTEEVRKVLRPA